MFDIFSDFERVRFGENVCSGNVLVSDVGVSHRTELELVTLFVEFSGIFFACGIIFDLICVFFINSADFLVFSAAIEFERVTLDSM